MTVEEAKTLRPGDEVYWNDPDEGVCSQLIIIQRCDVLAAYTGDDAILSITGQDGEELECLASELA
jgi:hypothetical protein